MMPPVVILCGGRATRLGALAEDRPKAMIEIAGKPFIAHQLELLKKNGITTVVLCIGHLGQTIRDFIKNGSVFGLEVLYSDEGERLLGTGGAVKKALPLLEDIFFVMYGDSYLDIAFQPIAGYFLTQRKKGLLTVFKNNQQWDKSNIIYKNGLVLQYDKNNMTGEMEYIDFGLSIWRKEAFGGSVCAESFDLADLIQELVKCGGLSGYEVNRRFFEIGSLQGLEETRGYLSRGPAQDF